MSEVPLLLSDGLAARQGAAAALLAEKQLLPEHVTPAHLLAASDALDTERWEGLDEGEWVHFEEVREALARCSNARAQRAQRAPPDLPPSVYEREKHRNTSKNTFVVKKKLFAVTVAVVSCF